MAWYDHNGKNAIPLMQKLLEDMRTAMAKKPDYMAAYADAMKVLQPQPVSAPATQPAQPIQVIQQISQVPYTAIVPTYITPAYNDYPWWNNGFFGPIIVGNNGAWYAPHDRNYHWLINHNRDYPHRDYPPVYQPPIHYPVLRPLLPTLPPVFAKPVFEPRIERPTYMPIFSRPTYSAPAIHMWSAPSPSYSYSFGRVGGRH